jgi:hypothetical protein
MSLNFCHQRPIVHLPHGMVWRVGISKEISAGVSKISRHCYDSDRGSLRRKASIYKGQHSTERHGHISMTYMSFEPTILVQ